MRAKGIHLTIKFLGEQSPSTVLHIQNSLTKMSGIVHPFHLKISGTGCFPNPRRPRVFWLGLEHDHANSLVKIHNWIEHRLEPLGFPREKRRFSPHLTLGRVKIQADYREVFEFFDNSPFPVIPFDVSEVNLMRFQLLPQGASYSVIESYRL